MEGLENKNIETQTTTTETNQEVVDIEKVVKELFDKGLEVGEIVSELQKMFNEQKISEEELKKGVDLVNQMDKEMASKQFGVDIL